MINVLGENYYIDLDVVEKYLDMSDKGTPETLSGETEMKINVIKFEMVKMLLETVLTEQDIVDEKLGLKSSSNTSIPFRIAFNSLLNNNFLLMPTVTIKPPLLKKCEDQGFYDKVNLISLKNTSLANYMNGCSLSLPYFQNNEPIGIMLNGSTGMDDKLLEVGSIFETIFSK